MEEGLETAVYDKRLNPLGFSGIHLILLKRIMDKVWLMAVSIKEEGL
jgi:hypothetical protein